MIIDNFKLIINMKYLGTVENDKGEIVAFSIAFPSMSELARSHYGHLHLSDLLSFKKYINHPKHIDLGLIGINPAIEGSSAGTLVLLAELMKAMKRDNIEYAETNLNLETNTEILNVWGNFNTLQHKRRRSFIKKVNE